MNRRNFLGSAIGVSIALSGLFKAHSISAYPQLTSNVDQSTLNLTDGDISVINHHSSLERIRALSTLNPDQINLYEANIYGDLINMQFLGDYAALDRLAIISNNLLENFPETAEKYILTAKIAASRHEFKIAYKLLEKSKGMGADIIEYERLQLSIQQAIEPNNLELLAYRKQFSQTTPSPQNLVPYGALLAENGDITGADKTYKQALMLCNDPSPFVPSWICFQLGVLWGEICDTPNYGQAHKWYERSLKYLPKYSSARVHLSEIQLKMNDPEGALNTLLPARSNMDPEVGWKLAEAYLAKNQTAIAKQYLDLADTIFSTLLQNHTLAFADHASEFYLGIGQDPKKALLLAKLNYRNRPSARAEKLLHEAELSNGM